MVATVHNSYCHILIIVKSAIYEMLLQWLPDHLLYLVNEINH